MNNFIRGGASTIIWTQIWRKGANMNRLREFNLSLNSQRGGGFRG